MQHYYDLEVNILSCLLLEPDLMKDLKLEDKHFMKHQRIWQFMKTFYEKFGTFDVVLMYQQCKDKFQIISYIQWLVEVDPIIKNFNLYQDELIQEYEQNKHDKYMKEHIFELANQLIVGKISLQEFYNKINDLEDIASNLE